MAILVSIESTGGRLVSIESTGGRLVSIESTGGRLVELKGLDKPQSSERDASRICEEFVAPLTMKTKQYGLPGDKGSPIRRLPQRVPCLLPSDTDLLDHVDNSVYWKTAESAVSTHSCLWQKRYRAVLKYVKPVAIDKIMEIRSVPGEASNTVWFVCGNATHAVANFMKYLTEPK